MTNENLASIIVERDHGFYANGCGLHRLKERPIPILHVSGAKSAEAAPSGPHGVLAARNGGYARTVTSSGCDAMSEQGSGLGRPFGRSDESQEAHTALLALLFEQSPSFMAVLAGPTHVFVHANPNYLRLIGNRAVLGRTLADALPDAQAQGYGALLDDVYASGRTHSAFAARYAVQAVHGGPIVEHFVDFMYQPLRQADGTVTGIFVEGYDVTERKKVESLHLALLRLTDEFQSLNKAEEFSFAACRVLGETIGVSRVGYGTIDLASDTMHVDRDWTAEGVESLAGVTPLRDYGSFIDSLKKDEFIQIEDVREDPRTASAAAALENRNARSFMNVPVMEQGQLVAVLYVNHAERRKWTDFETSFMREVALRTRIAIERSHAVLKLQASELQLRAANETLEQKVKERTEELMEVEARFRQSQKMEAIGQLTGGIAHDFNNLLGAMSTSQQVLERRLAQGHVDKAQRYITMTQDAIRRAASLTQRLLAFSRRQTLDPKPIDVNRLVNNLEDLIRRTVGPSVSIEVVDAVGLWLTRIDASQLENALLNLCINARDAMAPAGGRITIETANVWLEEPAATENELPPGQYVSLRVSDTGCGMSPETSARAFDPFFTTKPMGQGTGLGLSMVYGFARQSGGHVRIDSEVGQGTTMCLYVPRLLGDVAEDPIRDTVAHITPLADGECVLVVEDESTIRDLVVEFLASRGYVVVHASNASEAQRILDSKRKVDLLLTDVGLPGGMNGRQLAENARLHRPGLRVLFVTGYAESAILGHHLENGMSVITKPFDLEALAEKVRLMVDGS